ncbi:hypothetical protein BDY19DRAFT_920967 [Irpex rosettiformis]|uniref:Uncharacterized protein n=1 Tax=Irpex rosettiformis TaxID=378272 RepID=A0ACB8UFA9_9APHY|nr:hypothetical protein BDY19DRAFT_920967 [Irpex rosettiformis]
MSGGPATAVYASPGQWQGHYAAGGSPPPPGGVYPPGHHQYPSSSYVTHHSTVSLRPGQASPSSYQTVMAQTGGYQSPDRQSSPYNTLQSPSQHQSGLPIHSLSFHSSPTHQQPISLSSYHSPPPAPPSPPTPPQHHQHPQQSPPSYSHPRSLQAHTSVSYPSPPPPAPLAAAPTHYHNPYPAPQLAYTQSVMDSQYPASPQRPFSCDLCALSFNRQHDLKRHRDTHTGEKPFLCNGGCGKTFTRKDALKRHQVSG